MKASIRPPGGNTPAFEPFSVVIEVKDTDELYALTRAAGRMCNAHGLELYPLLLAQCQKFGLKDLPGL